ncbi:pseudouridine synthase [Terrihabitans sp. B22-R8]|uniref:pseudouridine synthase n=1 Tax=Terrihabitans sp. B22-R8 TaxID=3425128 RepID=UPI00403C11C5
MTDINEPKAGGKAADAENARIAKVIARAGLASRRDAELMVEEGRVAVNGRTITTPATNVGPGDRVTVDGQPLPARERTRLWLYHKPRGLVTTAKDPEGRRTVFEVLPRELPRVVSVGRLDLNTEGLLLLTNDGGLARVLSHPDTAWLRRYRVRAFGEVTPDVLEGLRKGVEIDGFSYGPIDAEIDRRTGDNVWLTLGLREGKNREVRRVLEHIGLVVNRLIRVSFGPFQLGDMAEGTVEEIRTRYLRDQLGSLADEAGCDFDAPVVDRTQVKAKRPMRDEPREGVRQTNALTTDRKGRRVLVQRIEKEKPVRPSRPMGDRPPRDDRGFGERRPDGRSPRRDNDAPRDHLSREDRSSAPRPPRPDRDSRPQRRDDEGGQRRGGTGGRPGRPPQRERDGEAPRSFRPRETRADNGRPSRGEGGDRPPRRDGDAPRPFRSRPDRPSAGPASEGRRPPREHGDARPSRRDDGAPRTPRNRDDRPDRSGPPREGRPPRRDGERPGFGGKPRAGGDRPFGGQRTERPRDGSPGGRGPGSGPNRPGGGRPTGGKPRPSGGGGGKPRTRG